MSDFANRVSGGPATAEGSPSSSPRRRIFSLLVHGKEIFLHVGTHTIGRALSCDIVLNDRLVSREHARLLVREATAAVIDLGSVNGVYVNETLVEGTMEVRDGDLIIIGNQEMTLRGIVSDDERATSPGDAAPREEISEVIEREPPSFGRQAADQGAPAPASSMQIGSIRAPDARREGGPHMTEKADAIQVMGRLADRAMVMGNYEAAEHVLEGHLQALLNAARSDVALADGQREMACRYALRLADALQKPSWIDFAVELHLLACKPMSDWCTTRMMLVVPATPGIDVEQFFFYQQMLKGNLGNMSAAERILSEQLIELKPRR